TFAMILVRRHVRRSNRLAFIGAVMAAEIATAGFAYARRRTRYEIYAAAAATPPADDMHPLGYGGAGPSLRQLDGGTPHRVAVTAGWDGSGHNIYLSPLLGQNLQNRIFYIPVRADGEIADLRDAAELFRVADRDAWLRRLAESQIDVLVTL